MVGIPHPLRLPLRLALYTRRNGCGRYPRCRRVARAAAFCSGVFQVTQLLQGAIGDVTQDPVRDGEEPVAHGIGDAIEPGTVAGKPFG
jgi:hypothetical protein